MRQIIIKTEGNCNIDDNVKMKSLLWSYGRQLIFVLPLLQQVSLSSTTDLDGLVKLPVLVLVPFPNPSNSTEGWDRGLELLPAARLAMRQINNSSNILNGYELQLIEADSDPCAVSLPTDSVNNFAQHSLNRNPVTRNTIAVLGLACSTVTASISLLSGRPEVDLLQLSMANSPSFVDNKKYKRLWRVLPSSLTLVETALSLMDRLNWRRVGVVYNGVGVYFKTTAEEFTSKILSNDNRTLVINLATDKSDLFLDAAIDSIQNQAVRIIYVSASIPETSRLMCKAVKNNLIWPGYQWIFNERTVHELLYNNNNQCSHKEMIRAIENVILVNFDLENRNEHRLVSGQTYAEYQAMYMEELRVMAESDVRYKNVTVDYSNAYANAMYDEVWTLSLAINRSLPDLQKANLSLTDYQYNTSTITDIIERHFPFISFNGAASRVMFDEKRETLTPSIITHVTNGSPLKIGSFNSTNDQLFLLDNLSSDDFPKDDFEVVERYLPLGMTVALSVMSGLG